jgi:hypothetical protein
VQGSLFRDYFTFPSQDGGPSDQTLDPIFVGVKRFPVDQIFLNDFATETKTINLHLTPREQGALQSCLNAFQTNFVKSSKAKTLLDNEGPSMCLITAIIRDVSFFFV